MKLRTIVAACLATAVSLFASAAPALAVPGQEGSLVAVVDPDRTGIHQGETVPVFLGLRNGTNTSIGGVMLNVETGGDLHLPRTFSNCWYYTNAQAEGAWCVFDQRITSGQSYFADPFAVSAAQYASHDQVSDVNLQWSAQRGTMADLRELAAHQAGPGTSVTKGSSGPVGLTSTAKFPPAAGPPTATEPMVLLGPLAQSPAPTTAAPPVNLAPGAPAPSTAGTATGAATADAPAVPGATGAAVTGRPVGGVTRAAGSRGAAGTAPAGGQFTEIVAQQQGEDGPPAATAAGPQMSPAGFVISGPQAFGVACFVALAGLLAYAFVPRRGRSSRTD